MGTSGGDPFLTYGSSSFKCEQSVCVSMHACITKSREEEEGGGGGTRDVGLLLLFTFCFLLVYYIIS